MGDLYMKNIFALLLFLISGPVNAECMEYEIYKTFIEQKFEMKLYSWSIHNNGSETIWLFVNEKKHFAWITVDLYGCSILTVPEEPLSFFKRLESPSHSPNTIMPTSRGEKL